MPFRLALRHLPLTMALGFASSWSLAGQPSVPATYLGTLPCADCAGIDWQLDLDQDHSFELRQHYQGKGSAAKIRQTGRWESNGTTLTLLPTGRDKLNLTVSAPDRLQLKQQGQAGSGDELLRQGQYLPASPSGTLTARYRVNNRRGMLQLCAPGQPEFPVAGEGDVPSLEQAYGKIGHAPGDALLVRVAGHLATRGKGNDKRQTEVVVERFYGIWHQTSCDAAQTQAQAQPGTTAAPSVASTASTAGTVETALPLTGTTWRLVELDGERVVLERGPNTPHLLFQDNGRLAGASGCNRVMGAYTLQDKGRISFGQMAGTMMACVHHMDQEQAFLRILNWAQTWQISGKYLVLRDGSGKALAIFLAAPLQR